jgi:hypothetical protein
LGLSVVVVAAWVGVLEKPNSSPDWLAFCVVVEAFGKGDLEKLGSPPALVSLAFGTVVEVVWMGGAGNPSGHPALDLPWSTVAFALFPNSPSELCCKALFSF